MFALVSYPAHACRVVHVLRGPCVPSTCARVSPAALRVGGASDERVWRTDSARLSCVRCRQRRLPGPHAKVSRGPLYISHRLGFEEESRECQNVSRMCFFFWQVLCTGRRGKAQGREAGRRLPGATHPQNTLAYFYSCEGGTGGTGEREKNELSDIEFFLF